MMKNLKIWLMGFLLISSSQVFAQSLTAEQWSVPLHNSQGTVSLSHYKGKVLWIDFWASWCPPCRASFPWMNAMQQKYGQYGFQVVGINVDENSADGVNFLRQHPAAFDVYFDPNGQAPELFNVQGMPTSLLVDRQGQVHLMHIGFEPQQKAELEAKIRAVLSGE